MVVCLHRSSWLHWFSLWWMKLFLCKHSCRFVVLFSVLWSPVIARNRRWLRREIMIFLVWIIISQFDMGSCYRILNQDQYQITEWNVVTSVKNKAYNHVLFFKNPKKINCDWHEDLQNKHVSSPCLSDSIETT